MPAMRAGARALRCVIWGVGVTVSICAAADEATVRALEAQCEAAREAKIRPLREAEIQRCMAEQNKDPDYCRRYWSDYGAAVRLPNGAVRPPLFSDLPECVAAHAARKRTASN